METDLEGCTPKVTHLNLLLWRLRWVCCPVLCFFSFCNIQKQCGQETYKQFHVCWVLVSLQVSHNGNINTWVDEMFINDINMPIRFPFGQEDVRRGMKHLANIPRYQHMMHMTLPRICNSLKILSWVIMIYKIRNCIGWYWT